MRRIYPILIFIVLLSGCQADNKKESSKGDTLEMQGDEPADRLFVDSVETRAFSTKNPDDMAEDMNEDLVMVDSIQCEIEDLFKTIESPLEIDYEFFSDFDRRPDKTAIPFQCIRDGKVEMYEGLPAYIDYAYGKFSLSDSIELYLVITGMNPENPMDLYFISASIMTKEGDKLDNELMIAKYHSYSMVKEEYYCKIDKQGMIVQKYTHTGEIDGEKDVFAQGDTTFNLMEINNLR